MKLIRHGLPNSQTLEEDEKNKLTNLRTRGGRSTAALLSSEVESTRRVLSTLTGGHHYSRKNG